MKSHIQPRPGGPRHIEEENINAHILKQYGRQKMNIQLEVPRALLIRENASILKNKNEKNEERHNLL